MQKIIFGMSLIFFVGCLSIISSIHKVPKIEKDFELYNKNIIDSFYKTNGGNQFYLSERLGTFGDTYHYMFFFDSKKVIWTNLDGEHKVTDSLAKSFYHIWKKRYDSFGIVYTEQNKYKFKIASGMRGLGYNFIYLDMEMLADGRIKLTPRKYIDHHTGAKSVDGNIASLINNEIFFRAIKLE